MLACETSYIHKAVSLKYPPQTVFKCAMQLCAYMF